MIMKSYDIYEADFDKGILEDLFCQEKFFGDNTNSDIPLDPSMRAGVDLFNGGVVIALAMCFTSAFNLNKAPEAPLATTQQTVSSANVYNDLAALPSAAKQLKAHSLEVTASQSMKPSHVFSIGAGKIIFNQARADGTTARDIAKVLSSTVPPDTSITTCYARGNGIIFRTLC